MRVKLARTAGFCMGVQRAMNVLLDAVNRKHGPFYTLGPLIHNPQVIETLSRKKVRVIRDVSEASEGTIVVRAHGIPPDLRAKIEQTHLELCDATCPIVTRAQSLVQTHAANGYTVIIAGDASHPEVAALVGFADGNGVVVSSPEDIDQLPAYEDVCLIAQTTQNAELYAAIAERVRSRYPGAAVFDTICDSTHRRQVEVRQMAKQVDVMVVVGGKQSANTRRLTEIAREEGVPAIHVETGEDLDPTDFRNARVVGITAGASTPNWVITGVAEAVREMDDRLALRWVGPLRRLWRGVVLSYLFLAVGAGCLAATSCLLQGIPPRLSYLLVAALYVYCMHVVNRMVELKEITVDDPYRTRFMEQHRAMLFLVGLGAGIGSVALSAAIGLAPFLLLLGASLMGLIYNVSIVPRPLQRHTRYRKLKDVPGSKDILVSLAWAVVIVLVPYFGEKEQVSFPGTVVAGLFTLLLVFTRSAFMDLRDTQGDRIVGRETIPVVLGKRGTRRLIAAVAGGLAVFLAVATLNGWAPGLAYMFLVNIAYLFVCIFLEKHSLFTSSTGFATVIDANFVLAGILGLVGVGLS